MSLGHLGHYQGLTLRRERGSVVDTKWAAHSVSAKERDVSSSADSATAAPEELLTPGEVAQLFRVNPKTVTRWAAMGRLTVVRTLGGHRRFPASQVEALLAGNRTAATAPSTVALTRMSGAS